VLSDLLDASNLPRLLITGLVGLIFGFAAFGSMIASPRIAEMLGVNSFGKSLAKSIYLVAMMFTIPQIILSIVGLDGLLGRALAGPILWGVFCVALDMGIRLRIRWTIRKGAIR
jgi:hypothetical protein